MHLIQFHYFEMRKPVAKIGQSTQLKTHRQTVAEPGSGSIQSVGQTAHKEMEILAYLHPQG